MYFNEGIPAEIVFIIIPLAVLYLIECAPHIAEFLDKGVRKIMRKFKSKKLIAAEEFGEELYRENKLLKKQIAELEKQLKASDAVNGDLMEENMNVKEENGFLHQKVNAQYLEICRLSENPGGLKTIKAIGE
ncbi:MAG: hypothetical protein ACI4W6_04170 [Acutalibacteraceae bacterium]